MAVSTRMLFASHKEKLEELTKRQLLQHQDEIRHQLKSNQNKHHSRGLYMDLTSNESI